MTTGLWHSPSLVMNLKELLKMHSWLLLRQTWIRSSFIHQWVPESVCGATYYVCRRLCHIVPDSGPVETHFLDWCNSSFLNINVATTNEMIVDFWKNPAVDPSFLESLCCSWLQSTEPTDSKTPFLLLLHLVTFLFPIVLVFYFLLVVFSNFYLHCWLWNNYPSGMITLSTTTANLFKHCCNQPVRCVHRTYRFQKWGRECDPVRSTQSLWSVCIYMLQKY